MLSEQRSADSQIWEALSRGEVTQGEPLIPNVVGGKRLVVMKVISGDESFPKVHPHAAPSAEAGDQLGAACSCPAQMTLLGLDRIIIVTPCRGYAGR